MSVQERAERSAGTLASNRLRQVARVHPLRPALDIDADIMSYAQLDRDVDELAQRLVSDLGMTHSIVVVRAAGTRAMVVALLAVERAAMVSVPVDPSAPAERVEAILDDVSAALVLSDIASDPADLSARVVDPLRYKGEPPRNGVHVARGELAAIVFTSGSTGTPKGIVISEAARIARNEGRVETSRRDGLTGKRFGFLSVGTVGLAETFLHNVFASEATFVAYDLRRNGVSGVGDWIRRTRINYLLLLPTIWRAVAPTLPEHLCFDDLVIVVLSGETPTWQDADLLYRHLPDNAVVRNRYGQTEIHISAFDVPRMTSGRHGPLPSGRVHDGHSVTIEDEAGNPVPDGEVGQIVARSLDAASGYWRRPELTARVFTELPDGTRRVRTGDRGRFLPDGSLQHLGRLDHLVKVAGNRIDLGDVEAGLLALDGVAEAAVTTYQSANNETRLVGYVVAESGAAVHPARLRAGLARRLPGPYLPDDIVELEALPRLAGGKVDRLNLPARQGLRPEQQHRMTDATTRLELSLVELWKDILDLEEVGINDDFFALGGDSMRAARLLAEIESRHDLHLPPTLIIQAPTIAALAAAIDLDAVDWAPIVTIQSHGSRPPLFVVHDGRGDVFYARRMLPQLGHDQPVYGIQPKAAIGLRLDERDIPSVAATYVDAIRGCRPHGPYILYGFSLGGILAFEVSCQLQRADESVILLGLGDSASPQTAKRLPRDLWSRAMRRRRQLHQLPWQKVIGRVLWLARRQMHHRVTLTGIAMRKRFSSEPTLRDQLNEAISSGGSIPANLRGEYVLQVYGALLAGYQPSRPFAGPAVLIRAVDDTDEPERGWGKYVTGSIDVVGVGTDHHRIHADPWAAETGQHLREAIDRVLAAT